jgi:tetratricopeptide (TPR) repeat protein
LHPSTLTSRRNLAVLAIQTGRPIEGLEMLEGLARDWTATRGAESPQALSISQLRSYVLQDLGRFEEAEQVLRRTVDVQVAAGGPREPLLLAARNDLGMVLMELGRPAEARIEFEGLMAWAEPMLDVDDPYLAIFRSNYGGCLVVLGHWQEARHQLERSRDTLRRLMGPQHARTRTAGERLLQAYLGLGLSAEAAALEAELAASPG